MNIILYYEKLIIKQNKIPFSGSRVIPSTDTDGQTDMLD